MNFIEWLFQEMNFQNIELNLIHQSSNKRKVLHFISTNFDEWNFFETAILSFN